YYHTQVTPGELVALWNTMLQIRLLISQYLVAGQAHSTAQHRRRDSSSWKYLLSLSLPPSLSLSLSPSLSPSLPPSLSLAPSLCICRMGGFSISYKDHMY